MSKPNQDAPKPRSLYDVLANNRQDELISFNEPWKNPNGIIPYKNEVELDNKVYTYRGGLLIECRHPYEGRYMDPEITNNGTVVQVDRLLHNPIVSGIRDYGGAKAKVSLLDENLTRFLGGEDKNRNQELSKFFGALTSTNDFSIVFKDMTIGNLTIRDVPFRRTKLHLPPTMLINNLHFNPIASKVGTDQLDTTMVHCSDIASRNPVKLMDDFSKTLPTALALAGTSTDEQKRGLYLPAVLAFFDMQSSVNSATYASVEFDIDGTRQEGKGDKKDSGLSGMYSKFTLS